MAVLGEIPARPFLFTRPTGRENYGAGKMSNEPNAAQTVDATGAETPNSGAAKVEFSPEQQAQVDRIISDRLTRAQEKWQAEQEKAKSKATEETERKRLEEEKNYQKLLEKATGKIAELEPLTGRVEQLTGALEQYRQTIAEILTGRIEALGETAKTAVDNLPGEPDALAKLKWLNSNEPLFKAETPASAGGTPPRQKGLKIQQPAGNNQQAEPKYQAPIIRF